MLEIILQAIKENQIENYLINKEEVESAELFFVKKELDMRRMKKVCSYEVTVYRDFEKEGSKMRGFSSIRIYPEMDASAVTKSIADAYYAASFVCNPFFELPKGKKEEKVCMSGKLVELPLEESAMAFAESLYKADCREDAFINSAEIFVSRREVAIWNSEGIEVSYDRYGVKGEFVVQCMEPQDVELYQDFSYSDFDTEALTKQAAEALDTVCARAHATKAPATGEYNVILSGKTMRQLFSMYEDRACAPYIYAGYSAYKTGMQVQGEDVVGEKVDMTLKAVEPYSFEGITMKDRELVKAGELKALHGNNRFCYYLGIEPTGSYDAILVENGTKSMEELKKEPYLHVVNFSDFHMDALSGYFGGEIRLAYLFDGENVTPVTGGSINGNLLELQKDMVFSTDRYKDSKYEGPMAVRLCHVPVAGV